MRSPLVSFEDLPKLDAVLLDARQKQDAYDAGHLAGAIHANLETQLSAARDANADPSRGGRHPLPPIERWAKQLGAWGITPDRNVVVYDDQAGANAAARLWWMLRSAGHANAFVLDGGLSAALPLTTDPPRVTPAAPYPVTSWQWPTVDMAQVDSFKSAEALRAQYAELFGEVPPERVVVHCGSGVTACHTLLALEAAGLHGASLYVGSWGEWCRNH
jgi:thiosulfate/3-mercaptopyruvate sulfurtransferase